MDVRVVVWLVVTGATIVILNCVRRKKTGFVVFVVFVVVVEPWIWQVAEHEIWIAFFVDSFAIARPCWF